MSKTPFDSAQFLAGASARPGVYVFYQKDGGALYVGKAVNLKSRLASYFRARGRSAKTQLMVSKIHRAEIHPTRTEVEALLLENNFIKDKKPRYNVALRDDKSFPYIRVSARDDFPRFTFYRGRRARGEQYFGPYPNAGAVREMLGSLHKIFRLRQCTDAFFRSRARPCLQHQINRCSAPCVGKISREAYREDVRQAKAMLDGGDFALIEELAAKMERASDALAFETAAAYRDRIALLQRARGAQYAAAGIADADAVAVALDAGVACFGVVSIRRGRNLGGNFQVRKNPLALTSAELLAAFLPQHYLGAGAPPEILLGENIRGRIALQLALQGENKNKRKVQIKPRCIAERAKWVEMARMSAAEHLHAHLEQRGQIETQLRDLAKLLSLPRAPKRIECFDISHTQGERAVGACVVAGKRGMQNDEYRRFNIENITPGDDCAALAQTLQRRYARALRENAKLPDIAVIDGGRGQLRAARRVLDELQLSARVTLLAVSKGAARRRGEEQLHIAGRRAFRPPRASMALRLIQRVRDEAHRFAISGHRRRRAGARVESPLQRIEGVGDVRRRNLLRYFGGMREIKRAGVEDLARAPGISAQLARRIHRALHE